MADHDRAAFDRHMMTIALRLAQRGLGNTAPNPAVGAVIADESTGEVLGRGWTQPGGRPHAEPEAIRRAGDRARGKTMYVTLEPCSHHGRTPPCVDAILAAGLGRVVCAVGDPDPRVSGRGLQQLRAAGIAVSRGLMADVATRIARGHILRVTERRPMVQLKLALAATGNVSRGKDGRPVWVTGPLARAHGHLLRAEADAILVGHGTVRDDDPNLTCRLPGLESASPVRVVLSAGSEGLERCRLVTSAGQTPTWVYCDRKAADAVGRRLAVPGVTVCPTTAIDGRLWLPAVLEDMVARGITRLLVEGGPSIWRAFAAAGLVDEVVLYLAPPGSANGGIAPAGAEAPTEAVARQRLGQYGLAQSLILAEHRRLCRDTLFVFRRP